MARGEGLPHGMQRNITLGIFGAIVLCGLGISVLSWRMSSYSIDEDALHLRTGVLNRQQRQARLDRLQAVDVVQPLLARFIGLAELRIEVAGGKGSAVRLAYLRESDAQSLRRLLLARAAGLRVEHHEQAPEAPEHQVLAVPVPMLIESLVRSVGTLVVLVGVAGLVAVSVWLQSVGFVVAVIPAMIGLVSVQWARFNNGFSFRVATSPDGLRLHHGLLQTTAQTVPPGRVQAVRLAQPLLWRGKDWWRVEVNVAGYGGGQPEGGQRGASDNLLLPVGSRADALAVLSLVLPDLGRPPGRAGARRPRRGPDRAGRPGRLHRQPAQRPGCSTRLLAPARVPGHRQRLAGAPGSHHPRARRRTARADPEPGHRAGAAAAPARAWRRSCCTRPLARCTRGSSTWTRMRRRS